MVTKSHEPSSREPTSDYYLGAQGTYDLLVRGSYLVGKAKLEVHGH